MQSSPSDSTQTTTWRIQRRRTTTMKRKSGGRGNRRRRRRKEGIERERGLGLGEYANANARYWIFLSLLRSEKRRENCVREVSEKQQRKGDKKPFLDELCYVVAYRIYTYFKSRPILYFNYFFGHPNRNRKLTFAHGRLLLPYYLRQYLELGLLRT